MVYVDDFELAGPEKSIQKGWDLIRRRVKTDEPSRLGMYLGCRHDVSERNLPDTGARVRAIEYNMEDLLRWRVERYQELTGVTILRRATTPFLQEIHDPDFSDTQAPSQSTDTEEGALRKAMKESGTKDKDKTPAMPQQLKP